MGTSPPDSPKSFDFDSNVLSNTQESSPSFKNPQPHQKPHQLTPRKRPFSENVSFSLHDPSRSDFSPSKSKGKAVLPPHHSLVKRALDYVNLEDDDDGNDEDTGNNQLVRKEFIDNNDESSQPFDLNVDLNLDFDFDTQYSAAYDHHDHDHGHGHGHDVPMEDILFCSESMEDIELLYDSALRLDSSVINEESDVQSEPEPEPEQEPEPEPQPGPEFVAREAERNRRMERFRRIAKKNAANFANCESDNKKDNASSSKTNVEIEKLPGAFCDAVKAIRSRGVKDRHVGYKNLETLPAFIDCVPQDKIRAKAPPSLTELCLDMITKNADALVSLEYIPDSLKHKICQMVCNSRKIDLRFLELIFSGSPTEIRIPDCSWITDKEFIKIFQSCDTTNLEVLHLGICGRIITDYVVPHTFAQSSNRLPRLISLSLRGACGLSDKGLRNLIPCIPSIRSLDLSQCSLITSASVSALADSFGSRLKELYLDDCQYIDAARIGLALEKLTHLEVLSVAGIESVSDTVIANFVIDCGHNLKELGLKDCQNLTDTSVGIIPQFCPQLCSLDLSNLYKLTDYSIAYLTNKCQALRILRLCGQSFSDEAIAAFLEINGMILEELSLNNVKKVGHLTALSLACKAKRLHMLDLSWCRNLTDSDLVFIVDNCLLLRKLKINGCTQITEIFLNGHSNSKVEIIGMRSTPLLQHVREHDEFEGVGALRYSTATDAI